MNSRQSLYVTGGAVPDDALCYVSRDADTILYDALLAGEFCYVLTPRQMGKSSLVIQTAERLRKQHVQVVLIDLQNLGLNLSPEQWYLGLLDSLGRSLGLQKRIDAYIDEQKNVSPLQLWQRALRDVVLTEVAGSIVLFIDEIDTVRGLAFSTDEFFAAIRACYNARAEHPELQRLTFCLLGVAAPTDLIRNPRLTPFNIGRRIDLQDFTLTEAALLQHGLGHDTETNRLLLERIYYWTGGHPFLTQRLCKAIAENGAILTARGVDACCRTLFLAFADGGQRDDNLVYVQQRLLPAPETNGEPGETTDERRAALLSLYGQVVNGKSVPDNETGALIGPLKLSGAVKAESGLLRVRNRIYAQVFDNAWIHAHMPGAELRRQRAAFRRGAVRTFSISAMLLAVMGTLTFEALHERQIAEKLARDLNLQLYTADMSVMRQAYQDGDYGRLNQLLNAQRPRPGETDLRGFEWRYYWRLMNRDLHTFKHVGKGIVFSSAYSCDHKTLASSNEDGTIKLWDTASYRDIGTLTQTQDGKEDTNAIKTLAFSPVNPSLLASGGNDATVRLWDVKSMRLVHTFKEGDGKDRIGKVRSIAFSADGRLLASGSESGDIMLWDAIRQQRICSKTMSAQIAGVTFTPDGSRLASATEDGRISLWAIPSMRLVEPLGSTRPPGTLWSLAVSPNGKTIAAGMGNGSTELWDIASRKVTILPRYQRVGNENAVSPDNRLPDTDRGDGVINGIAFSPDGGLLATGSWDNTVRLWDVIRRRELHQFIGHNNKVTSVAFSQDGRTLVSTGGAEIKLWDALKWEESPIILPAADRDLAFFAKTGTLTEMTVGGSKTSWHDFGTNEIAATPPMPGIRPRCSIRLSPEGNVLAVGELDGTVILWDVASGRQIAKIIADTRKIKDVGGLAFSPNGKILATASGDSASIKLWDIASRHQITQFEHENNAHGIAISPDGNMLAAASWTGQVHLWNIATREHKSWNAHTSWISDVCFSPDGKTLATASADKTVKLWNLATEREMVTFSIPSAAISVMFSRDGTQLAVGGHDGTVRLYFAISEEIMLKLDKQ